MMGRHRPPPPPPRSLLLSGHPFFSHRPPLTHRVGRLHGHPPRPHIIQQGPRVRVAPARNQAAQQLGRPAGARPGPVHLAPAQAAAELGDVRPEGSVGHGNEEKS